MGAYLASCRHGGHTFYSASKLWLAGLPSCEDSIFLSAFFFLTPLGCLYFLMRVRNESSKIAFRLFSFSLLGSCGWYGSLLINFMVYCCLFSFLVQWVLFLLIKWTKNVEKQHNNSSLPQLRSYFRSIQRCVRRKRSDVSPVYFYAMLHKSLVWKSSKVMIFVASLGGIQSALCGK